MSILDLGLLLLFFLAVVCMARGFEWLVDKIESWFDKH
jgi:hypothetical protein